MTRSPPCQGGSREFESRFPLHLHKVSLVLWPIQFMELLRFAWGNEPCGFGTRLYAFV